LESKQYFFTSSVRVKGVARRLNSLVQKHSKQEIVNDICRKADRVKLKKVEKALVLSILENERTDESVNQDLEEKV
jgi:hypothetical protein